MKRLSTTLIAIVALMGCNDKSDQHNSISLRFDWTTNMSFAGDVCAMYDYAKKYNISDFKCEQAGEGVDPVKMVLSGANNIGVVSFENFLAANEKNADLVAIGFINPISPTVFLAKENKQFEVPKDFEGKSVGIMPGGATEMVYRAFVKATNIDRSKIRDIPAGFDVKGFVNDDYDIKLSFIYVENVALDEQGVRYKMIEPKSFGVYFPGRVYFAKRKFVESNPDLVQRFINSTIDGWKAAFSNPAHAVELLKRYDAAVDEKREAKSFTKAFSYFNGDNGKFLMVDEKRLSDMVNLLKSVGLISDTSIGRSVDLSFVKKYYSLQ